jgi:hypothetical protein
MNFQSKIACILAFCFVFSVAGPVSYYGALKVSGNRIKDSTGTINVQLKGPSFFWSAGNGEKFYNSKMVDWFVDTMDISVIRNAMAVGYYNSQGNPDNPVVGGYLNGTGTTLASNKNSQKNRIEGMVQAAIRNDIYVIIDWHSHRAQSEQSEAIAFFKEMAIKYKDIPNVIFEIYNEPPCGYGGSESSCWSNISGYMRAVIDTIRATGSQNLILVGSPMHSSRPDIAANSNLHTSSNGAIARAPIAYTMHFYAASHSGEQRSNAQTALNNSAAVFVSEWGTTAASGSGSPSQSSTTEWTDWMDTNSISSCNWSVSDFEASSIFNSGSIALNNLRNSGTIFFNYMKKQNPSLNLGKTNPPTGWPWGRSQTVSGLKGSETKTWSASDLELTAGATFDDATATAGSWAVSPSSITYTAPASANNPLVYANYYIKSPTGNISKHRLTINLELGIKATVEQLNISLSADSTILTQIRLGIQHVDPFGKITFTAQDVTAGTIKRNATNTSLIYIPPPGAKNGETAVLTYTIADNFGNSVTNAVTLRFIGSTPILGANATGNFELAAKNSRLFAELAKNGVASLDIYSISGAKVASLMSGSQNAGSYEFNIGALQKGVYIIRLKQGSEVRILRTVVK